jgi:predicted DNA-binding protein
MDQRTAQKIILLSDRVPAETRDRWRQRLPQDAYTHGLYLRKAVEAALDRGVDLRPSAKDACEQIRATFPETCHYHIPF